MCSSIKCFAFGLILCLTSFAWGAPVSPHASFLLPEGRFYWATTFQPQGDNNSYIIAAGQKKVAGNEKRKGYLILLREQDNDLMRVTEESFAIRHKGKMKPARIRTVAVVPYKNKPAADIYIVGKSGGDNGGVGFLKRYVLEGGRFTPAETFLFSETATQYTHGYPLRTGDIDGDGNTDIIYGGFSGDEDTGDRADVRVFSKDKSGKLIESPLKPFANLPVRIRVNALEIGDVDNDGSPDIVIAGRTKEGDMEHASFAWWSKGKTYHKLVKQQLSTWLRTLLIADIDGDGKNELLTGGRVNYNDYFTGALWAWKPDPEQTQLLSRYTWTGLNSTRFRTMAASSKTGRVIAAGRMELPDSDGQLRWKGFIQPFSFKDNTPWPDSTPLLFDKNHETRIRNIQHLGNNRYLVSGFTEDARKSSSGFIFILDIS